MTVTAEFPRAVESPALLSDRFVGLGSRATPTRLRLVAMVCVGLTVLVGVVGFVTISSRHTASTAAWQTTEPLMVDAQAIDTSLSDADTTAAGSFLDGQLQPIGLHDRYLADINAAAASLATTSQKVGTDTGASSSLQTISVALPTYTGLVETATFNQRQGNYPLAASYMAEANNLMRTAILPAAAQVYQVERARLMDQQRNSVGVWMVVLTVVLIVALLAALAVLQRWMSRRFRRTINVAVALATLAMAAVGIWFGIAVIAQNVGVDSATANGSGPVATYTQARILALQMRADDELTLLSRDSVGSYQSDYGVAVADLRHLLTSAGSGTSPADRTLLSEASGALDGYALAHSQIRRTDTQGDLIGAVAQASATGPTNLPAVSSRLDQSLGGAIDTSQHSFDQSMSGATDDIGGLLWGIALLSLLSAVLIAVGVQPRIAEYR
jgi:hypothetical protein